MTYPPQGPYGQQPDPYGQQQPPQYGGGYQQQPGGQFGGYDPNAQYGGGYQQYGGMGGPPEPPKSKTGPIIAVVAVVVLLLGGLGITGFVAPGFFLSDDKDSGDNAGSGETTSAEKSSEKSPENSGSGSDELIDKLVAAADEQDKSTLRDLKCSEATDTVDSAISAIDKIDSAEFGEIKDESDDEVRFTVTIVYGDKQEDDTFTVKKDGGDWCWHDIKAGTPKTTGGSDDTAEDAPATSVPDSDATGDTEGEQFVQSFLDKLNGGDGAGAAAMSCSDSTSQSDITEAAAQGAALEMDPAGTTADDTYVGSDLKGTLAGAPVTGRTSAFLEDGAWCIYTFFAS
ncbi:hypothetical protein [Actinophytocola glycyrrhizae]|uniref:DUF4878 domain-containing protein n=1 Tax=Actinophytocola glycyrrhizae TaxID=2044873 RepID=A0ABV9SCZ1_9PSEU